MKSKTEQFIEQKNVTNLPDVHKDNLVSREEFASKKNVHGSHSEKLEFFHEQWEGYREVM